MANVKKIKDDQKVYQKSKTHYKKPNNNRQIAKSRSKKPFVNEVKMQKIQERKSMVAEKIAERQAERAREKEAKEERIRIYKKKRLQRTKIISKKTQRGQPLMKDRMEFLLKQIQEMKRN